MTTEREDVYAALADWYLRLDSTQATDVDRDAFAVWLAGSAVRQRAYAEMAAGLSRFHRLDQRIAGVIRSSLGFAGGVHGREIHGDGWR